MIWQTIFKLIEVTLPVHCYSSPWITEVWNRERSKIFWKFPTWKREKGDWWVKCELWKWIVILRLVNTILKQFSRWHCMRRFSLKTLRQHKTSRRWWHKLGNNEIEGQGHPAATSSILILISVSSDMITWDSCQNPSQLYWITLSRGSGPETGSPWQSLKRQQLYLIGYLHLVQQLTTLVW